MPSCRQRQWLQGVSLRNAGSQGCPACRQSGVAGGAGLPESCHGPSPPGEQFACRALLHYCCAAFCCREIAPALLLRASEQVLVCLRTDVKQEPFIKLTLADLCSCSSLCGQPDPQVCCTFVRKQAVGAHNGHVARVAREALIAQPTSAATEQALQPAAAFAG